MNIAGVLLLVQDSELPTHPYSLDMDTDEFAANSTALLHCFLQNKYPTNQLAFVGERASGCFDSSSPLSAKWSLKCSSMSISRSGVAESILKEMLEI